MPNDADLGVVGAGIVGLAVARELQRRRPDAKVVVLDREDRIGLHQTGRNSGVIHAGIYYAPGSLKARLCVEGARLLYEFCDARGIAYERCGKVIVATRSDEVAGLDELERRGIANGVPGLRRVDAAGLRELEPHAAGVAALHSPNTGIVDYAEVARALGDEIRENGGEVRLGVDVVGAEKASGSVALRLRPGGPRRGPLWGAADEEVLSVGRAVFCAGGRADRLAVAGGADPDPRIVPFRGSYLLLKPERRSLVNGLIYPVPDPSLPFLGVHLTKHVTGDVSIGPTALLVPTPHALRWPGTWKVAWKYRRTAAHEVRMALQRRAFVAEAARYVPALRPEDVGSGPSGVRAQAVGRDGSLVDDFVLSGTDGAVHVRNAPSPAATSSLAIAKHIADAVGKATS